MAEIMQLELTAIEPAPLAVVEVVNDEVDQVEPEPESLAVVKLQRDDTSESEVQLYDPHEEVSKQIDLCDPEKLCYLSASDRAAHAQATVADIHTWAARLIDLCVAHRMARQEFFEELFTWGEWREMTLHIPELSGASNKADADSRRWSQFLKLIFASAKDSGRIEACDLPSPSEAFEWFWLFQYRQDLMGVKFTEKQAVKVGETIKTVGVETQIPERLLPSKRSHVRPLREATRDCRDSGERAARISSMLSDMTPSDQSNPLTADGVRKWGKRLAAAPQSIPVARQNWRALDLHPPKQSKFEEALEQLNKVSRKGNVPAEVLKAIQATIRTFKDDRHLMVEVDEGGMVKGLLTRKHLIFGRLEEVRNRDRGKRGARKGAAAVSWFTALLPIWDVVDATPLLMTDANDYRSWKRRITAGIFPPPSRKDGIEERYPVVMPNASQAETFAERTEHLKLKAVPLVAISRFISKGAPIIGRHWEDVADEVLEVLEICSGEEEAAA